MKICPICQETYNDDTLNYCLNDGGTLTFTAQTDNVPPTIFMDQPRQTNPNWTNYQPPTYQNQQIAQHQPFETQWQNPQFKGKDQTLPLISLILGILSIVLLCCYGGIPLGLAAAITGFIGMNNANRDPINFGGKAWAVGGMVIGLVSLLLSIIFIIFAIAAG